MFEPIMYPVWGLHVTSIPGYILDVRGWWCCFVYPCVLICSQRGKDWVLKRRELEWWNSSTKRWDEFVFVFVIVFEFWVANATLSWITHNSPVVCWISQVRNLTAWVLVGASGHRGYKYLYYDSSWAQTQVTDNADKDQQE